jgi:hypothetical protein
MFHSMAIGLNVSITRAPVAQRRVRSAFRPNAAVHKAADGKPGAPV